MKKYLTFLAIRFTSGLQYRTAAWAGIATQFAWGFMRILLYTAFYREHPGDFPMELSVFCTYIWLQQATIALFFPWFVDNQVMSAVESGGIAYELCRPMDIYSMWYLKTVATRLSRALLRCFPILLVAFFLPRPYGLTLPSPQNFLLFLASGTLGLLCVSAFNMLVTVCGFYTVSTLGLRYVAFSAADFLAGGYIPLAFFSQNALKVLRLLPFASMCDIPVITFAGGLETSETLFYLGVQAFWLAVMAGAGKLITARATKRIVVQGG